MKTAPASAAAAEARSVYPLRASLSAQELIDLRVLAARRSTTVQALTGQAIRELLRRSRLYEVPERSK